MPSFIDDLAELGMLHIFYRRGTGRRAGYNASRPRGVRYMARTDLDRLSGLDLSDRTNRLILADALEDAGRTEEAALVRGEGAVTHVDGQFLKVFTPEEIRDAFLAYRDHHELGSFAEMTSDERRDDNGHVIGFRLSRDVDGQSHGHDETFGAWK